MGGARFGPCELIERIRSRGEIEVWSAVGPGGERLTVRRSTRVPGPDVRSSALRYHEREARIGALFDHPNLARIACSGVADGCPWVAYPFRQSAFLDWVVRRAPGGRLPTRIASRIVADLCAGVEYVHRLSDQSGPLGILLRVIGQEMVEVCLDGSARIVEYEVPRLSGDADQTMAGAIVARLDSMSPEQAMGEPLDARHDVWVIGILALELLAARSLVAGASLAEVVRALASRRVPPPSAVAPHLPSDLLAVLDRALQPDRGRRLGSAALLADELERLSVSAPAPRSEVADYLTRLGFVPADPRATEADREILDTPVDPEPLLIDDERLEIPTTPRASTGQRVLPLDRPAIESPDFGARYSDVRLLRHSSRTSTWEATDSTSGGRAFIKLLASGLERDLAAVAQFANEPMMAQYLRDRGCTVVPLFEAGRWRDRPFFVQPFLEGWSLSEAMRNRPVFTGATVLKIMEDCLGILASVHDAGVVHADLSPENVFVCSQSPPGGESLPSDAQVRIVDFELARRLDLPPPSQVLAGKPPYLAPELTHGTAPSPASDLYALGIAFYELLVGRRPYDVATFEEVRTLREGCVPPIPMMFEVPLLVEGLVLDLLAFDPSRRPQRAIDVLRRVRQLRELARWVGGASRMADRIGVAEEDPDRRRQPLSAVAVPPASARQVEATIRVCPGCANEVSSLHDWFCTSCGCALGTDDSIEAPGRGAPPRVSGDEKPRGPARGDEGSDDERRVQVSTVTFSVTVPEEGAPNGEGAAAPGPSTSFVTFSIFAPSIVRPGIGSSIDLWIHRPDDAAHVSRTATMGARPVSWGEKQLHDSRILPLVAHLQVDGFDVEHPVQKVVWGGPPVVSSFMVRVPRTERAGPHMGSATIVCEGLLVGRPTFSLQVSHGADARPAPPIFSGGGGLRTAFASYASQDRDEVLRRVQGMSAAGVDVFVDVISLRAGQRWEKELYRHIRERDVFYLFWSRHARSSDWVEREWKFALRERGPHFIHPVPLVDPRDAPPPSELAQLHFNDLFLAFLGR